jgi:hypothetical protein
MAVEHVQDHVFVDSYLIYQIIHSHTSAKLLQRTHEGVLESGTCADVHAVRVDSTLRYRCRHS